MEMKENFRKKVVDYFSVMPNVVFVSMFGSYARDLANEKSDIDLAILFKRSSVPDTFSLIAHREELSSILKKEVDLVCLNHVSPIIGMQVYKYGEILLLNDRKEYANYQMTLFTDYAELKSLRAPMEKNILNRKYYDR